MEQLLYYFMSRPKTRIHRDKQSGPFFHSLGMGTNRDYLLCVSFHSFGVFLKKYLPLLLLLRKSSWKSSIECVFAIPIQWWQRPWQKSSRIFKKLEITQVSPCIPRHRQIYLKNASMLIQFRETISLAEDYFRGLSCNSVNEVKMIDLSHFSENSSVTA